VGWKKRGNLLSIGICELLLHVGQMYILCLIAVNLLSQENTISSRCGKHKTKRNASTLHASATRNTQQHGNNNNATLTNTEPTATTTTTNLGHKPPHPNTRTN